MKIADIYNYLDNISPFELQEKWDNSGLNVGSMSDDVKRIVLSMDIDEQLLDELEPNTLLITHHPLIFSSLKVINYDKFPASFIKKMIKKDISLIAMHTNFDKSDLNRYVALHVLHVDVIKEEDFVLYFEINESFEDFCIKLKRAFNLESLKVVTCNRDVKRVALTTGSGASLLSSIECDCFLTGDIKFHDAMLAKALQVAMVDITHFDSEKFFVDALYEKLNSLEIEIQKNMNRDPFETF